MGISYDRISNLPDPILQSILSLLPLKSALRTSTLSKRWRSLWEFNLISATSLDFGEDFACSQSPTHFVSNLHRYLRLHGDRNLERLRILFCPFDLFRYDVEQWITIAVKKQVRELDINLSQGYIDPFSSEFTDGRRAFELPDSLYDCETLFGLSLSRCDLRCRPFGFSGLLSLSLDHANVTHDMLQRLLVDCPLLESLSLMHCQQLSAVNVTAPGVRLQRLVIVDCGAVNGIEISAPKLKTFHYYGQFCDAYFYDLSSLEDAFVSSIGWEGAFFDDAMKISDLARAKILTVCTQVLMQVAVLEEFNPEAVPIQLQNLQELQLLMVSMNEVSLANIYSFFQLCPSPWLEKLFIRLPRSIGDPISTYDRMNDVIEPLDVSFDNLRVIKLSNFKGTRTEMRLVKFLLGKAVNLESLILVAPPMTNNEEAKRSLSRTRDEERLSLRILRGQLSLLPKASPGVRIELCEFCTGNKSLNPTHMEVYCDDIYFSGDWQGVFRPLSVEEAITALT